jgi:hypothetical protein
MEARNREVIGNSPNMDTDKYPISGNRLKDPYSEDIISKAPGNDNLFPPSNNNFLNFHSPQNDRSSSKDTTINITNGNYF